MSKDIKLNRLVKEKEEARNIVSEIIQFGVKEEQKYDISISLDYEDYIKEYISKQKIDNDKFKSGLMEEYDKVIEIYKEEFKNKIK